MLLSPGGSVWGQAGNERGSGGSSWQVGKFLSWREKVGAKTLCSEGGKSDCSRDGRTPSNPDQRSSQVKTCLTYTLPRGFLGHSRERQPHVPGQVVGQEAGGPLWRRSYLQKQGES